MEKMRYRIDNSEIQGDPINSISLLNNEKKKLVVHSRDNCIRIIDFSNPSASKVIIFFLTYLLDNYQIFWIQIL